MTENERILPVSVSFQWQWWEEYYQRALGRPAAITPDWLDETYLGRQRFLYEEFGQFGIGQAVPSLDGAYLGCVMPYWFFIIPILLGVKVRPRDIGGYLWRTLTEDQLRRLKPIDIAQTPLAELILREREAKLARYGAVSQLLDLGSATNNAFVLRGPEFYADLAADVPFARHYLGAITETICLAYRFVAGLFPLDGAPLANCNVHMMGPRLYAKVVREYDILWVEYAAQVTGKARRCDIHHCSVKLDPFVEAYGTIPGLHSLQAHHASDIAQVRETLPGVAFSAMVDQVDVVDKAPAQLYKELERCIALGANDLAIWEMDVRCNPRRMAGLFADIERIARQYGRRASFAVLPLTWEELDWQFPRYRGTEELPGDFPSPLI